MADIFTIVKGGKKKVYNIAGGTEEEAMKYVRYLHKNALFGTHTGLPPQIKNSKMNESLVSNIGDYSVLDVYAYPQTKCIIGTVVNFHIINDVNPLGSTYVYPCTDKNKPMGYMISDATPDTMGVCLVHGVLEVPLYYFSGSTEEKKDFVEYDIENACFKFSDSGYPVFNVYQDVDGDWIAIILFGDVSSDYEYDGPFAVSVAGVTGSTTYVNVNSGDVLFNDIRGTYDEDLTEQVALNTGESVWLKTSITGNTHAYDLIATSTTPIDGSTVFYTELAKNVDGKIVQNQYGDIRYSRTKLIAGSNRIILSPANGLGDVTIDVNEGAVGTTQDLFLTGSTVLGSTASIGITDSTSKINIVPENDLYVRTGAGTNELIIGSTTTAYIDVATSVSGTNDASISFSNINGLAKTIHIKAGSNIQLSADGTTGIIVSATGGSVTPYVQDLTHSFSTGTATLGLTGSAITVSFTTTGNTYIEEGSNGEIVIGSTSGNLMCASTETAGLYSLYISDTSDSKVYLKEGAGISLSMSGSTITIIGTTYTEGTGIDITDGTISNLLTGDGATIQVSNNTISYIGGMPPSQDLNVSVSGTTAFVGITDGEGFCIIAEGNAYLKTSQYGVIIGSTYSLPSNVYQDLTCSVNNTGTATISLSGSTDTVKLIQGDNITITAGQNTNEVVINSTVTGNTGTVTGITSSVVTNFATVSTIGGSGDVVFVGAGNSTVYGGDNGEIVIGSTFTEIPQDLSTSITGTTAFINLSGSTSNVKLIKGNNITLDAGEGSNEIVIGSTFSEFEYDGPFAVKVDHADSETPTTLYVTRNGGVITYEKNRKVIGASSSLVSIVSGESYWLEYNTVDDTVSIYRGASPRTASNNVIQIKLAENDGGVLKQIQFGEIILNKQSLTSSISGGTAFIGITGNTNTIKIVGTNGVALYDKLGYITLSISGYTNFVTGITYSVGVDNTATISTVGGSGDVVLRGGSNTYIESGFSGEIVIGSTVTGNTGTVTGITSSISGNTATISSIGGTGTVKFYGIGGTTVSEGANGEIIIGSTVSGGTESSFNYTGSFKVNCWDTYDEDDDTIHHFSIIDSNNRDDDYTYAGWVHIGNQKYGVFSIERDFIDGDVVYLVGTFNDSNALSSLEFRTVQTFFPTINDNQFCVRICYATNGKMYQTQYGDIVQPARLVGDGETTEIHNNVISAITGGTGVTQGLYSAIKGGTPAICITGSTTYVPIAGGTNTYTERDSSGAIIVGCTASGGGGSGGVDNYYWHVLTSVSGIVFSNYLQARANSIYNIYTPENTGADIFTSNILQQAYPSIASGIDDGGDLLVTLPHIPSGQTEELFVDFYMFTEVKTVFLAEQGINIVEFGTGHVNYSHPCSNRGLIRLVYVPSGINSDYPNGLWMWLWI